MNEKKRFMEKFEKTEGCWIWKGYLKRGGYGGFNFNGKTKYAHRVAYEFFTGDIPEGMCVCHTCDNPSCVNPSHLFLGTHRENMQDAYKKGRVKTIPEYYFKKGDINLNAKLTVEDVKTIKARLIEGHSRKEIANDFGVSTHCIRKIDNGERWSHVKI